MNRTCHHMRERGMSGLKKDAEHDLSGKLSQISCFNLVCRLSCVSVYWHVPIIGTALFDYRHLHERTINGESTELSCYTATLVLTSKGSGFLSLLLLYLSKVSHVINSKNTCSGHSFCPFWCLQLMIRVMPPGVKKRGRPRSQSAPAVLRSQKKQKKHK